MHNHLSDVAELAEKFILEANPQLIEAARWAGLLHDLGKYCGEFQDYLRSDGKIKSSYKTHHAVYGAAMAYLLAKENNNPIWRIISSTIAGHHAGLHNFQRQDTKSLCGMVQNPHYRIFDDPTILENLHRKFESEIINTEVPKQLTIPAFLVTDKFKMLLKMEMATRMIFSSLVDADFLDTEKHYQNNQEREPLKLNAELLQSLLAKLEAVRLKKVEEARAKNAAEKLIEIRNSIYENCPQKADQSPGFFSLTVPTGGAKTLAAIAFALKHALTHNLRRVIVVIPYLSIIEQNAKDYRDIFGADVVIENHSSVVIKGEDESNDFDEKRNPLALTAENWDAPVIVTASVQFIESLFSHKPSRCRKLHNIARSVVIFDEVQTVPAKLLEPLFSVWRELAENYAVSFVFSTATQPAFKKNETNFKNGFSADEMREITDDTDEILKSLNRVEYDFENFQTPQTWQEITAEMLDEPQILCVVNTRKHAFELWNEINLQKNENNFSDFSESSAFHLSSAMCAEHRLEMIDAIKRKLKNGEECRVVSTQLIEAGVDLDFPILFRAAAPLDSIVQAAGRCNREGKLTKGLVKNFTLADNKLPPGIYKTATEITCSLLESFGKEDLATNHEIFADYFKRVYQMNDTGREIQDERKQLNFREVSAKAKVIENEGIGVIVPYKNAMEIVRKIRFKNLRTEQVIFGKDDLRSLQRYMVNLYPKDFEFLRKMRYVEPLIPNKELELHVVGEGSYNKHLGVLTNGRPTNELYGRV